MSTIKPDIAVVYIFPTIEQKFFDSAEKFVQSIKKYNTEKEHQLIVVLKGNDSSQDERAKLLFDGLPTLFIKHSNTGFDIGSFLRIARQHEYEFFLFLGAYCRIQASNWIEKFMRLYEDYPDKIGVVGATGSWGKDYSSIKGNNYHIRTSSFLIKRNLLLLYPVRRLNTKMDTYMFEHGNHSLTWWLMKNNYLCLVVDKYGNTYYPKDWRDSRTYCSGSQENCLIVDNMTDQYIKAIPKYKGLLERSAWGNIETTKISKEVLWKEVT